ncbi:hypothetical protein E0H22_17095 [Rhodopseudomonas boonkerdii]|uniref:hypothetical protein n=1 Tax=Rhodopseudomonas boonkerdii TaxID=475937 RepID=UPI001E5CB3C5|nr:hypothetical protein [Rhodopseudomonas boonkerdii]UGV27251.1 hypothetical protein E0H22_17095 [Rhodopseudomonas boonkerdii]
MTETTERDRGLLSLIDRLVKRPNTGSATKPLDAATDDGAREGLDPVVPEAKAPVSLEPQIAVESTRDVTRIELADLIVKALKASEGYPDSGFEITVYGAHPWNAMLRITPAAGAVNAETWRDRLQAVVLLFRDRYEIKEDTDA